MAAGQPALSYRPIHLRHLVDASTTAPGAVQVLGRWFAPQDRRGVNGPGGWVSAEIEDRLLEEGRGKIRFANAVGGDGVRHVDRFRCLGSTAAAYAPGDEWIEIYEGPFPCGDLVACVTPGDPAIPPGEQIELECTDAVGPLKAVRETTAGHWTHAPRDAIEHYTGVWATEVATGFARQPAWPAASGGAILTSPDGRWDYFNGARAPADPGAVLTTPPGSYAYVKRTTPATYTPGSAFRVEASFSAVAPARPELSIANSSGQHVSIELRPLADQVEVIVRAPLVPLVRRKITLATSRYQVVIEGRGRWVFFYLNGSLLTVEPWRQAFTGYVQVFSFGASVATTATVASILLRTHQSFLARGADKGDYRLPGAPTPGGLIGEYFDDADIGGDLNRVLSPVREPYARRQDPTINFAAQNPPTWQPVGPAGGTNWSVRWTGAIYLDLATSDRSMEFSFGGDTAGQTRVWIGKTRFGEQIIDYSEVAGQPKDVTQDSLRTHLGTSAAGWYPIVIEMSHRTAANGLILLDNAGATAGGGAPIPSNRFSPLGIYTDHVRHESHQDQIAKIASSFGYQWRCEPRQLESGLFPGELVPRVRVGRDTAYVLDEADATDVGVKLAAREVAHTLIVDAAGTADPASGNQLTREAIDFDAITRHLIVHQGMENLADITDPALLEQRANLLLELFASAWMEVNARPAGGGSLQDAWALTGVLARFDWQPGDGIRRDFPSIGVTDLSPVQILGVTRTLVPAGAGVPVVAFRQRPRSYQAAVRGILKTALQPRRTYQGTESWKTGSYAHRGAGGGVDALSRVPLPTSQTQILSGVLVVTAKSDASAHTIVVNGAATPLTVTTVGRYPVDAYVASLGGAPVVTAATSGGTGSIEYVLELLVRI